MIDVQRETPKPASRTPRVQVDNLSLLRGHPVFGALAVDHLERLCTYATTRTVPPAAVTAASGTGSVVLASGFMLGFGCATLPVFALLRYATAWSRAPSVSCPRRCAP